jgi:hypothetical protein
MFFSILKQFSLCNKIMSKFKSKSLYAWEGRLLKHILEKRAFFWKKVVKLYGRFTGRTRLMWRPGSSWNTLYSNSRVLEKHSFSFCIDTQCVLSKYNYGKWDERMWLEERCVSKLVARLLATAALWVWIQTYLNNEQDGGIGKFAVFRYDKISLQNTQSNCKKIRQKSQAKNLPKPFWVRKPRICPGSVEQQKAPNSVVR